MNFFLAQNIMKICLLRDLYFRGKTHVPYKEVKFKINIRKIDESLMHGTEI